MKKLYKLWAIMAAIFMIGFVALSVDAAQDKLVQVEIIWWENNCTFGDYALMSTGFSYAQQILESNVPGYTCTMEAGDTDEYVNVVSNDLTNDLLPVGGPKIPDTNVKLKHVVSTAVSAWNCGLSDTLATSYTDISTATELFVKDDYTVCTVTGSTQIEVTVPASLPVGLYTGNIVFTIY